MKDFVKDYKGHLDKQLKSIEKKYEIANHGALQNDQIKIRPLKKPVSKQIKKHTNDNQTTNLLKLLESLIKKIDDFICNNYATQIQYIKSMNTIVNKDLLTKFYQKSSELKAPLNYLTNINNFLAEGVQYGSGAFLVRDSKILEGIKADSFVKGEYMDITNTCTKLKTIQETKLAELPKLVEEYCTMLDKLPEPTVTVRQISAFLKSNYSEHDNIKRARLKTDVFNNSYVRSCIGSTESIESQCKKLAIEVLKTKEPLSSNQDETDSNETKWSKNLQNQDPLITKAIALEMLKALDIELDQENNQDIMKTILDHSQRSKSNSRTY